MQGLLKRVYCEIATVIQISGRLSNPLIVIWSKDEHVSTPKLITMMSGDCKVDLREPCHQNLFIKDEKFSHSLLTNMGHSRKR